MRRSLLYWGLFFTPLFSSAQATLEGTVTGNGDTLAGAHITIGSSYKGAFSNAKGYYRLTGVDTGTVILHTSFMGYRDQTDTLQLQAGEQQYTVQLRPSTFLTDEVTVSATRVSEKTPIAHTNVSREDIEKNNAAKDMPYILDQTPSTVATSDAGAGVGYSQLRIRGSAPTRLNVTINGIPLNDAESQGVYWVNIPDLAASTNNIQIQRGVGSSTNGAGAFGGTINIRTTGTREEPFARTSHTYGSFDTRKHNVAFGSGILNDHWVFEGRLSKVHSNGYIDRATTNSSSYYLSGGYVAPRTSLKFVTFSGREKTYQAWYGMPEASLDTNRTFNPYNYENETDNYEQTHYQLHFDQQISARLSLNAALHYTIGKGYFEQYKGAGHNQHVTGAGPVRLSDYGLEPVITGGDTTRRTDLIQRRWLDNDFYGGIWSLKYRHQKLDATLGGGFNQYYGEHYGEVIWARYMSNGDIRHRYYDNDALKNDFNIYGKVNYQLYPDLTLFADLQYRNVSYRFLGIDQNRQDLRQERTYDFFNPKAGLNFDLDPDNRVWASWAVGNKEPNRTDHVNAPPAEQPGPETLFDYEAGYERQKNRYKVSLNFYYMDYENQLVQTGEINDVGRQVRTNVNESFRRGIEFQGGVRITNGIEWQMNATWSQNKILGYTEYVDNWATGEQTVVNHGRTDIAFSPSWIGASNLNIDLWEHQGKKNDHELSLEVITKYVGKQYIDNTSSEERMLEPYLLNDIRLSHRWQPSWADAIELSFLVRNALDERYVTNGWVYRYQLGGEFQQSAGYFPQAGRHYLGRLTVAF